MADRCRIHFIEDVAQQFGYDQFYAVHTPDGQFPQIIRIDVETLGFVDTGVSTGDIGYWYDWIAGTHDGQYIMLSEAAQGQHGLNDYVDWVYNVETHALSMLRETDYPTGFGNQRQSSGATGHFVLAQYGYLGADKVVLWDYPDWSSSTATIDQPADLQFSVCMHPAGLDFILFEGDVDAPARHYQWNQGLNKWAYIGDMPAGVGFFLQGDFSLSGNFLALTGNNGMTLYSWPSKTVLLNLVDGGDPEWLGWSPRAFCWSDDERYMAYSHDYSLNYQTVNVIDTQSLTVMPTVPGVIAPDWMNWMDRSGIGKTNNDTFIGLIWDWDDESGNGRVFAEFSFNPFTFIRKGTQRIVHWRDEISSPFGAKA